MRWGAGGDGGKAGVPSALPLNCPSDQTQLILSSAGGVVRGRRDLASCLPPLLTAGISLAVLLDRKTHTLNAVRPVLHHCDTNLPGVFDQPFAIECFGV